jgi:hypothetical protein
MLEEFKARSAERTPQFVESGTGAESRGYFNAQARLKKERGQ